MRRPIIARRLNEWIQIPPVVKARRIEPTAECWTIAVHSAKTTTAASRRECVGCLESITFLDLVSTEYQQQQQ